MKAANFIAVILMVAGSCFSQDWRKTDAQMDAKIPKTGADEFRYDAEMTAILAGTAVYCENLRQAAFHYFCNRKK